MTKNVKFVITRFVFSSSKCTKIRVRPGRPPDPARGAYDAPTDPLVGWGWGYPLPIPLPARRFGVSNLTPTAPRFSGPLNTKSWLRQ